MAESPSIPRLQAFGALSGGDRARVEADSGLRDLFAHLERCEPRRFPSEREAAAFAHCSRATLKRHLRRATGLSYRRLRDRILMRAAARTLGDPTVPIKSAARALGYRSSRAFDRAFSRWYGSTPGRFRRSSHATREEPSTPRADRSTD